MNARLMGRPARAAAALGALVAAGAVTLVATMGTANAAGAGRCVDNVNVRAQPDISSDIVAVCERGQAVQIGEIRDGFVELTDLKGWAAQEFVSVNGHVASAPATPRTTSAEPTPENGDELGHTSGTARHSNPAFADDAEGTDAQGGGGAGDDSAATATPSAGAEPSADGTDASATDPSGTDQSATGPSATGPSATDPSATDSSATGDDPNAAPTTQASKPASPLGALGGLLG